MFQRVRGVTEVARCFEQGSLRLRFPSAGGIYEGVLLNTGGGIAGGDRLAVSTVLGPEAHVVVTSSAAEKVYRAECDTAQVGIKIVLADGARLDWLPQETILFDGARLRRTLEVDMAPTATLTLLEIIVFGRVARAERIASGTLRDRWRVRRGGRLALAEDVWLDGPISDILDRCAVGASARAVATLLHIAPAAEARLAPFRRALRKSRSEWGASAWNGGLLARFADLDPERLRAAVGMAVTTVTRAALPRSWSC